MRTHTPAPQAKSAPQEQDELITPTQLKVISEEKESERAREAHEQMKKAEEERQHLRDAFMEQDIRPDAKARVSKVIRNAAENGQREVLAIRFPSELCEDRGVAINNFDPNWPRTLQGFAARAYEFYERELRPHGYKIRAQILNYPGGMLGEVGIYLSW